MALNTFTILFQWSQFSSETGRNNWEVRREEIMSGPQTVLIPACMRVCVSCSVMSNCDTMDCSPPGSSVQGNLQGIFPTQGSNPRFLHCRWTLTVWATREVPSVFRYYKNSIVVGEETETHWPPSPGLYLPVQSLAYTLLLYTPSGMSCTQAAFAKGRISGAHLVAYVVGRLARVKGCGWGSRRRGVVGGTAAMCVHGGRSALNRGPHVGFHNDLYSPWNSPGQNTGVGKPFPPLGDLPNPGVKPRTPTSQADFLPAESQGKPMLIPRTS